MGNIVHIEFTTADVTATAAFASAAFGWNATPSPFLADYQTVDATGDGIGGAIMSSTYQQQPVIAWVEVADIERTIESVIAAGGTATGPVHDLPGHGRVTYVTDPAGVVYGLKQPSA